MASPSDSISMALFCDFENVALGVRDAQYEKFDIKPILERLLLKGSIVVKKAYCDWERYKGFKATMHEANFELIEIPHVRQSGKNSADIRLVVDALDLCYTKSHVNTFVIISGDSDFSPLVSKLRENNKQVIGVGVKQSTSDLLIANCDEFIFYDDLVRENQRAQARRQNPGSNPPPAPRRSPEEERSRKESQDARRTQGVELAAETFEALLSERGDSGKIWASVLKEAIKRRKPDFSEGRYGFRTFGNLLEEAQARGLLEFGRDEKSGAYVFRSLGAASGAPDAGARTDVPAERPGGAGYFRHDFHAVASLPETSAGGGEGAGRSGRSRGGRRGEGAARSGAPLQADVHQDVLAEGRADPGLDARGDAPPERPGGSYFSQPAPASVPVPAPAEAVVNGATAAAGQADAPVATGSAEAASDAPATLLPTPAPRSRRTAPTPRKGGGRKAAAVGHVAPADTGAVTATPAAPQPADPAAEPTKPPRPRKPRNAAKPAA
ncbi:MAG: NYN domain-containing protein [Acidovorax sp.]|nr:NYN domain-containing protein [Acidovorax sp.]